MSWVWGLGAAWLLVAVTGAVGIGRSIRLAERREVRSAPSRTVLHDVTPSRRWPQSREAGTT
ncbi:hypothetical protein [Geodermatophilus sabuli]|uniref:Uncharacterized protein n=1 Tax=Geodermatophilus sabuli TaxID=1564158 RepID=A0A285EI78_9ACTN|nr:hypothetical protein [Geodermatophilus sabuli]MBB3086920.1 hypothetical protein [Geodermatophilus sabuli]SNX98707.1 hypothetical protein SAMN06893097_1122 [Geodermatophilus sabuli]